MKGNMKETVLLGQQEFSELKGGEAWKKANR